MLALLQLKQCGYTWNEGEQCLCILCNARDELSDVLHTKHSYSKTENLNIHPMA